MRYIHNQPNLPPNTIYVIHIQEIKYFQLCAEHKCDSGWNIVVELHYPGGNKKNC